jgi:hypothetical protein
MSPARSDGLGLTSGLGAAAQQARVGVLVALAAGEAHHALELGQGVLHPAHGLRDGVRRAEHHLGAAVREDVLPLLRLLALVHGHVHAPERVGGVRAHGPLHAVVGDDGHPVPRAHAELGEPSAQVVHQLPEAGVGRPLPRAVLLLAEELAAREGVGAALEDVHQRLEVRALHGRHSGQREGGERSRFHSQRRSPGACLSQRGTQVSCFRSVARPGHRSTCNQAAALPERQRTLQRALRLPAPPARGQTRRSGHLRSWRAPC